MSLPDFAELLERLLFTPGRNGKVALLRQWFASQPDPDRGIGLAALAGELVFRTAKPALLRELIAERTDPTLFALSYDYVGDLAETIALLWPEDTGSNALPPSLAEVIQTLETAPKSALPGIIAAWLNALDSGARLALIKLITGGLRVGASARLAKAALAEWAQVDIGEIEEVWHSVAAPYLPLFTWLEGKGPRPDPNGAPVFRPLMLAHPLEDADCAKLHAPDWRAEWKWDGIRVQLTAGPGGARLWSRSGEDISNSFPEILAAMRFHGVADGELLVMREGPGGGEVAPFSDLQQRLNRKTVTAKMLRDHPAHVRL
ncbi:MAG: cisplatin damage response ATP-dependent DNA ligase, partial [Roseococcus sp.]